jgi:hypothetical protein
MPLAALADVKIALETFSPATFSLKRALSKQKHIQNFRYEDVEEYTFYSSRKSG